jgi:anionic cell wall polymer biosynthesis LytR-Cps2A-Psr (LCP) family protein
MPLEVQEVETLVGVPMDHVLAISIPGLRGATDALGGVTVDNPSAFSNEGYRFREGEQRLNGKQAVAFVRRGGATAVDDATRAEAQEAFVRGALDDLLSAKTLLNPAALSTVVSVLSPYLTVDEHLDAGYVGQLGLELRSVRSKDITVFRMPTVAVGDTGPVNVLQVDQQRLPDLQERFKTDTLAQYAG